MYRPLPAVRPQIVDNYRKPTSVNRKPSTNSMTPTPPPVVERTQRFSPDGSVFSRQCVEAPAAILPTSEPMLEDLAATYFSYVTRRLFHIVGVRRSEPERISFTLARMTLLGFEAQQVSVEPTQSRIAYAITGGLLARPHAPFGTLSISVDIRPKGLTRFCLEVADYHPRLAGYIGGAIYRLIQSPIHQWLGDGFVTWAVSHQWRFEEVENAG